MLAWELAVWVTSGLLWGLVSRSWGQKDIGLISTTEGSLFTPVVRALQSVAVPGEGASGSPIHPFPQYQMLSPELTTSIQNPGSITGFHLWHLVRLLVELSYGVPVPILISPTCMQVPLYPLYQGVERHRICITEDLSQPLVTEKGKRRNTE